jgi:hypothetical protein
MMASAASKRAVRTASYSEMMRSHWFQILLLLSLFAAAAATATSAAAAAATATATAAVEQRPQHILDALAQRGRRVFYFGVGSNMLRSKVVNRGLNGTKIEVISMVAGEVKDWRRTSTKNCGCPRVGASPGPVTRR